MGLIKLKQVKELRIVGSGTTLLAALSTTVLGTFLRRAGERLSPFSFVTDSIAGATWAEGISLTVGLYFQRTAVADQFELVARNLDLLNAFTVDWLVLGVTP